MRADRLLSLLMLLQARGKLSARALAAELGVCERTIYRDVEALSSAGVPIYGETGPEGGYALLDSYRTTLTGLSDGELRALFMLSIPSAFQDLGLSQQLKGALLKLSAALPAARRDEEERVRRRFYLDSTWWRQGAEPVPHLRTVQQAVWEDRELKVRYRPTPVIGAEVRQAVEPYGLVAKAGTWYVVWMRQGSPRVYRVAQLLEAELGGEGFTRSAEFDLPAFWQAWCAEQERSRTQYPVTVRLRPHAIPYLSYFFGSAVRGQAAQALADDQGRITLELGFESLEAARDRLLALGGAVEVLEPLPLRLSMVDLAERIAAVYRR